MTHVNAWQIAFIAVNFFAALITIGDKIAARRGWRRVPEQTLFLTALLGGAAGMYLTMLLIRHKTQHKRFMLGLPLILILQFILVYLL